MRNPMMKPAPRLDYLDAVRAFALLLGIVFHASLSFLPVYIGWAVMDVSTGGAVSVFALVSHSFRMELFFLIAGFFSHMTFHRKGAGGFFTTRLVRIGIPFVVGWFLLRPLLVGAWVMGGESMRGEVDVPGGLLAGFRSLASLPTDLFVGTHLWFLYYLMLITGLTLLLRALLVSVPVMGRVARRGLDRVARWLSTSPLGVVALAVPTAVCLAFMNHWGMDTPDRSLAPDGPVLGVYTLCFGLGWMMHRHAPLMAQFARLTRGRAVICVAAIAATVVLSAFEQDPGHPWFGALHALFVFSYALMMWSLVALCIGLFKRFLDRPSAVVRYLADASYWLYLVHLPVVIWWQIAVAELPLHWTVKWLGVSVLTIGLGLVLYDAFVRSTVIGKILNGRRKARVLFASRPVQTNLEISTAGE